MNFIQIILKNYFSSLKSYIQNIYNVKLQNLQIDNDSFVQFIIGRGDGVSNLENTRHIVEAITNSVKHFYSFII